MLADRDPKSLVILCIYVLDPQHHHEFTQGGPPNSDLVYKPHLVSSYCSYEAINPNSSWMLLEF